MDENIAIAVLGALNASTLGYLITRFLFSKNHSVLVVIWLVGFCVSFVVLLMITTLPGMTYSKWFVLTSILPVSFVGWYFGHATNLPMSTYDGRWKIGFVIFLMCMGFLLAVKNNLWVEVVSIIFISEAYFVVFGTVSLLIVSGLVLLLMNDE